MNRINIKKLGFAMGLTGALVYLGCIVVMLTAGREGTIDFFNSLLHGLDTTSIIRMDIPLWEAAIGIVQTFIIGWLIGALIAAFYNVQLKNRRV
ncbi:MULTISPECIES: DUF5676 family membrane protein [unclassified Robiginitalea]|uniref:DUF5676 family membrane protein n=1 Tax=Robiginitalea TaxID=252306 RepID=UPI00234AD531|nr:MULTISPECIES: DUF5676 family membrane protein [unclassified Robiginitalea]MDC6353538.1 DUF5676 family membrane protein [Robiginitalea sp. PM2]MDC6373297.1 DUF5676 family membrane protein [Robiginitalea sp. SP8]